MSSNYKLTYFNLRGRGEVIRYLFALADVEYEDNRLEWNGEEWSQLKDKTLFGQIPTLEVDGKVFCQSHSIEKYLAHKFGLAGKTDLDRLKADMVIDCLEDSIKPRLAIRKETSEEKKVEMTKHFVEEGLPKYYNSFVKMLEGDGHFIGNELTVADVAFCHYTRQTEAFFGSKFDITKWPELKSVIDGVEKNTRIAAWIAKRPITTV